MIGTGIPAVVATVIPELRAKYGPNLLFVPISGGLVFRVVTRGSLLRFEADCTVDPVWARIHLFRAHILYPDNIEHIAVNISVSKSCAIADAVIQASGFYSGALDAELMAMRAQVLERDHAIIRHICRAYPSLTPLDINKMSKSDIIYLLAQAEMALGVTYEGTIIDEQTIESIAAMGRAKAPPQRRAKTFDVERDQRDAANFDGGIPDGDWDIRTNGHRRLRK